MHMLVIIVWRKLKDIWLMLFSLLHRACCRVTQLLHQPLRIYKIYKIYTLKQKRSDMFRS